MTNKQIKKLAEESFVKQNLNQKKVNLITRSIKRSDMKKYIKALKVIERKNTIYVVFPVQEEKNSIEYALKTLKNMYPFKKAECMIDPSLMAGVKIINDDLIYDFNMKNTLHNIMSYINNKIYD